MVHCIINRIFKNCWQKKLRSLGYVIPDTEFWSDATSAFKSQYPDFIFLAECYHDTEPELVSFGFDYVYDKVPYDKLRDNDVAGFIQQIWMRSSNDKSHSFFFTENHDENRAVCVFGNPQKANDAAACFMTFPGMRFFNTNQWEGQSNKIEVHLRRANEERPVYEYISFYDKLFGILKLDSMKFGEFIQLNVDGSNSIPAWSYSYDGEHILVTVNYANYRSGGYIKLNDLPNQSTFSFKEMFSGKIYYYDNSEVRNKGIFVLLDPYQVQIFKY